MATRRMGPGSRDARRDSTDLSAEIEAPVNGMTDCLDSDILRGIESFSETLCSQTRCAEQSASFSLSAPFSIKISLPSPNPNPPNRLYNRLLHELDFTEGPSLLSRLEKLNVDLFSCFPINGHLYEHATLLSVSPSEVLDAASEEKWAYTAINLNEHCGMEVPRPPLTKDGLPVYVTEIQKFFSMELEAREKSYVTLLCGYCRALACYLRQGANEPSRCDMCVGGSETPRRSIAGAYYREAARFARLLYMHLYLSVTRDVSRRLEASQRKRQNLFADLRCDWHQLRHFQCLFQPVIFNHGVVIVEGRALTAAELRTQNYVRSELGLPVMRCELVEERGMPLTAPPAFLANAPRASAYLFQCIKSKLEVYSLMHPPRPRSSARGESGRAGKAGPSCGHGTIVKAMLRDSTHPGPAIAEDIAAARTM
ncbi:UL48 protein [Gallid alphaherpesvirus 3]|uniref:Alpha trans-inducing protein n=2 Tax=Gallid alphaherpesvirus 3 TaxID=35250 RepID=Q9QTB7_9ALPH|nr:transactivating tegument protein VP16 [Gallid alphaherpesvirus 3]BAA82944.1 UL48 product homolog [Marek's disease virus serotype 2 MDV2]BAB16558.1 UL48 protein [Gallid alphaherpesvirus 3]